MKTQRNLTKRQRYVNFVYRMRCKMIDQWLTDNLPPPSDQRYFGAGIHIERIAIVDGVVTGSIVSQWDLAA